MLPKDLVILGRSTSQGYAYLKIPDHPRATKLGYVYEHRFVVEKELGRFLTADEVVHHRNHIKTDNSYSNLELTTPSHHAIAHGREQTAKALVVLPCAECSKTVRRIRSRIRDGRTVFCSPSCNMRFHRKNGVVTPLPPTKHGSAAMYSYHKCRCDECRNGARLRMREWRTKHRS